MEDYQLSEALQGRYTQDKLQRNPVMEVADLGSIDLRNMTTYQINRMEKLGLILPGLKLIKQPKIITT